MTQVDSMVGFPVVESLFFLLLLSLLLLKVGRQYRFIVIGAFLLRAALSYIHTYVVLLPDSQFDAIRFESVAWSWARDQQCVEDFTTGSLLYAWLSSCVYMVVGRTPLILQLINAFFGTLIVLAAMKTIELLGARPRYRQLVGWILTLHPTLLLYSAITMREVAVVLTFSISLYWLVKWIVVGRYRYAMWAVAWMLFSQLFHTGMLAGSVILLVVWMYRTATNHWRHMFRLRVPVRHAREAAVSIVTLSLFFIAGLVMLGGGYGLEKVQRLTDESIIEALRGWQVYVARGRAGYLTELQPSNAVDLLLHIPLRLVYFVGAPFPWQISRFRDMWGFVDGIFTGVLLTSVLWRLRQQRLKSAKYRTVVFVVALMMVGFALVTSNYGTAFRHRGKFVPVLVVLYSYGTAIRNRGVYENAQGELVYVHEA